MKSNFNIKGRPKKNVGATETLSPIRVTPKKQTISWLLRRQVYPCLLG